jgi:RHS repeat-associated protein
LDNNGNLEVENTSGTRATHTRNDENQLSQVARTGMTTNQYTFNGDGQRVQIVDSQGTKKPIWDFENILLETDGSDVTQVVYTVEPNVYGNLVSQRRGSTTSFYLFDALGSTRKLADSSGSITDSYDYRAYGETFASSGSTANPFRWVGELGYYYDIDRLAYYLRARPYNPAIARFLSEDPMGFEGSKWNLYEYSRSTPVNVLDPSGLVCVECHCKCARGGLPGQTSEFDVYINTGPRPVGSQCEEACNNRDSTVRGGARLISCWSTGFDPCKAKPTVYCWWWDVFRNCSRSQCQRRCNTVLGSCFAACIPFCARRGPYYFGLCIAGCEAGCLEFAIGCFASCQFRKKP